jgi:hypothetical protein
VWSGWVISVSSLVGAYGLAASHDAAVWWVLVWAAPTLGCASVGALLCLRVLAVVTATLQPTYASLWLRPTGAAAPVPAKPREVLR